MVEVLICGAGPAGAAAALWLARRGVRVLVVDRATFPRRTLCGDTLNPGAMALLRELGVAKNIARAGLPVRGLVVACNGATVSADYPDGATGLAIPRHDLDAMLVRAIEAAGAQVRQGVRVVGPLIDGEAARRVVRGAVLDVGGRRIRLPASVTIAADGRRSTLALALGLTRHPPSPRRWAIGGYFERVEGTGPRGEVHIGRGSHIGITALPGGLTNAYVVSPPARAMRDPRAFLLWAISRDPALQARFADARLVSPVMSVGPLAVDASGAGAPGLLLAGDAAGVVDPITGDGLRLAIGGGILAAQVALAVLEQPHLRGHVRLSHLRAAEIGTKLKLDRLLRGFVSSDAGVRACALVCRRAPAVIRRLVVVAGDVGATGERLAPPTSGARS